MELSPESIAYFLKLLKKKFTGLQIIMVVAAIALVWVLRDIKKTQETTQTRFEQTQTDQLTFQTNLIQKVESISADVDHIKTHSRTVDSSLSDQKSAMQRSEILQAGQSAELKKLADASERTAADIDKIKDALYYNGLKLRTTADPNFNADNLASSNIISTNLSRDDHYLSSRTE